MSIVFRRTFILTPKCRVPLFGVYALSQKHWQRFKPYNRNWWWTPTEGIYCSKHGVRIALHNHNYVAIDTRDQDIYQQLSDAGVPIRSSRSALDCFTIVL